MASTTDQIDDSISLVNGNISDKLEEAGSPRPAMYSALGWLPILRAMLFSWLESDNSNSTIHISGNLHYFGAMMNGGLLPLLVI